MTDSERLQALERSNAELRGVLILAGREIKKLNFGKKDSVLREARTLKTTR